MRALYTVMLRLALPFLVLRLWWRGRREPGYREFVAERFGVYGTDRPERLVWLHAVSVGEARAAEPLVRALSSALPDHKMLITCTTAAGRETIKQVYGESALNVFLPYDFPETAQAFLEYFRPRLGIVMETEVWPNLLAQCARHGVSVMLANARLSENSARGYRRWRALAEPAFGSLAAVCAQSAADAERLRGIGARSVEVTGNLKFDVTPDAAQVAAGAAWRKALGRPVILLASTREGEEAMLLASRPASLANAGVLIVVVPRHPRRFDEVAALADSRRSLQPMPGAADRVHVGDSMGEMAFYYGACDVAIIGGSFAPLGGQNLIEALAVGAPVIVGPHMYNFAEATELALEAGAAIQVAEAASALRSALDLLAHEEKRRRMGESGRSLCNLHRGATARHLAACRRLLKV
ncbi:MAG TPA: 3-deoxy-D-manno-octulosonic acid transferase [Burkholderiales bacterium]|nr:3-deoxy-D-manno-octulosonic acid transferase [Burkholderiales bacterium]